MLSQSRRPTTSATRLSFYCSTDENETTMFHLLAPYLKQDGRLYRPGFLEIAVEELSTEHDAHQITDQWRVPKKPINGVPETPLSHGPSTFHKRMEQSPAEAQNLPSGLMTRETRVGTVFQSDRDFHCSPCCRSAFLLHLYQILERESESHFLRNSMPSPDAKASSSTIKHQTRHTHW